MHCVYGFILCIRGIQLQREDATRLSDRVCLTWLRHGQTPLTRLGAWDVAGWTWEVDEQETVGLGQLSWHLHRGYEEKYENVINSSGETRWYSVIMCSEQTAAAFLLPLSASDMSRCRALPDCPKTQSFPDLWSQLSALSYLNLIQ